jgi:hypothetical protein
MEHNLNLQYTQIRDYAFALSIQFPYSDEEILSAANTEILKRWAGPGDRYRTDCPQSKVLKEIFEIFKDPAIFKQQILDTLYATEEYKFFWLRNKQDLFTSSKLNVALYKDSAKYYLKNHLDPRDVIVSGMYYLTKSDLQYTTIYTSENNDNPIQLLPSQYQGWMLANTENSWHDGRNEDSVDRIAIYYDLYL